MKPWARNRARRRWARPAAVNLLLQVAPPLAVRLELLGDRPLSICRAIHLLQPLQLRGQRIRLAQANAALETRFDLLVNHLGQATQLPPHRPGLPRQHLEHPVLRALRQLEVVAPHLVGGLQLPVDPPVPLLDATGVPGKVEVEQVGAVRLEVQAFASGVRGEQDSSSGGPAPNAGQVVTVQNLEDEPEPLLHLPLPLFEHRWRRGHDDGSDLTPQKQFCGRSVRPRFFAQPRVVGDEEVDPREQQRLPQRLHLVGVDRDPGSERRLEERRVGRGGAAPTQRVQEPAHGRRRPRRRGGYARTRRDWWGG